MKKNYLIIFYLSLLFLLLIYPHILNNHISFIKNSPLTSTIVNFILISIGILIYTINQKKINIINKEKNKIEWILKESYQHVGIVNWSLDYIKDIIYRINQKQPAHKEITKKLDFVLQKAEKWQK